MQRVATLDKQINQFKFFPVGVEMGNKCIKQLLGNPPNIAAVDEIGRYELAGDLWSEGFTALVESSIPLIFTTKEKQLERVIERWKIEPNIVFRSTDFGDSQKAFESIKRFL